MADVVFDRVQKTFGTFTALHGLDLAIGSGEFVSLLGPSGCGKTTTLRMLAGLDFPSSGDIRIGDRLVNDVAPGARDIAMVFQSYALYPHMTVEQNIAYPLRKRGVPKAERAAMVARTAEMLQLGPLLGRKPAQLSGGQQQRVALGRALVRDPKVFLLDEPLSNLDAKLRVQMRTEIKALQRKLGLTTIFVTHDQEEALTTADRIAVMDQGVIQQIGTPIELFDNPANRFVATFVGSINLLPGRIEHAADGAAIFDSHILGRIRLPGAGVASGEADIAVRPHSLLLSGTSDAGSHAWLEGEVLEREFVGEFVRYVVAVRNERLTADQPHHVGEPVYEPGQRIHVGVDAAQLRVLPR